MTYIYKTGRAELHDQIKRYAHVIRGRVLDIGAGSYPRYKHIFKFDEYLAMDIAPANGVDVVGTIQAIPFPDNSFDSIVCTQVLGDVFELPQAFAEINRVLKPGGIALITESLFDPLHDEPHDFWRFTPHSLRRLAENAAMKVEAIERRGGYFSLMAQLKTRYWIERLGANNSLLARPMSFVFKIFGTTARTMDTLDRSHAGQMFTHGYILIVRKHSSKDTSNA